MTLTTHPLHPGIGSISGWSDGTGTRRRNEELLADPHPLALSAYVLPNSTTNIVSTMRPLGFVPGATWVNHNSGNTITSWFRGPQKTPSTIDLFGSTPMYYWPQPTMAGHPGYNGSGCCGVLGAAGWTPSLHLVLHDWTQYHLPLYPKPIAPAQPGGCLMMESWLLRSTGHTADSVASVSRRYPLEHTVTAVSDDLWVVQYPIEPLIVKIRDDGHPSIIHKARIL